jgi:hypothetical protein
MIGSKIDIYLEPSIIHNYFDACIWWTINQADIDTLFAVKNVTISKKFLSKMKVMKITLASKGIIYFRH